MKLLHILDSWPYDKFIRVICGIIFFPIHSFSIREDEWIEKEECLVIISPEATPEYCYPPISRSSSFISRLLKMRKFIFICRVLRHSLGGRTDRLMQFLHDRRPPLIRPILRRQPGGLFICLANKDEADRRMNFVTRMLAFEGPYS